MSVSKPIADLIDTNLELRTTNLIKKFAEKAVLLNKLAIEYQDYMLPSSGLNYNRIF